MTDLAVGLIGPGIIADHHAEAIDAAGSRVVAVAGPEPDGFANRHGVESAYRHIDDLLEHRGLDAVVIASPSELHATHTIAALHAGLHVLCEVPAATSLEDANRVAQVAQHTGRHVAIAHTLRFCDPLVLVRERITSGMFDLRHVLLRQLIDRRTNTGMDGRPRSWPDDVVWHHGSHLVDAALWLLDATEARVVCACGRPERAGGRPLDAAAILTAPDGDLASVALSHRSTLPTRDIMLIGDAETLRMADGCLFDGDRVLTAAADDGEMERIGLRRQDRAFLTSIADNERPSCTIADVLPVLAILDRLASATLTSPT